MSLLTSAQLNGLRELAAAKAQAAKAPPMIAFTGAKGGVGKTLVAVNVALLLQQRGYRTLLVDLDRGCGNVDVHLRLSRARSLDDAVQGQCPARDAVAQGPFGLGVLSFGSGLAGPDVQDEALLQRTFAAVAAAAHGYDVVVCDTGAGIGPLALAAAERADATVAIATPDPSALTDAYAQCKLLHLRGRPLPHLLMNGVRSRNEAMQTAGKFAGVCRQFLGQDAPLFGVLRRDAELERSALQQRPLALHGTGPAAQDLQSLCAAALAALPTLPRRSAVRTAATTAAAAR